MKFVISDYVVGPTTHAKQEFQSFDGSVPPSHSNEIYTFDVYFFYLSIYLYIYISIFFMFLLTCTGHTLDHRNIINGS